MGNGSFVYLLKTVDDSKTLYKIGHTKTSIRNRIKSLQTGSALEITVVDYFESKYANKIEVSLHNLFSYKRLTGEWFELDISDEVNFKSLCEKYDNIMKIIDEKII
jgi:hypothetical protein